MYLSAVPHVCLPAMHSLDRLPCVVVQNSSRVTLWLHSWDTRTLPQYLATLLFLFLAAVAQEYVAGYRAHGGTSSSGENGGGLDYQSAPPIRNRCENFGLIVTLT